MVEPLLAMAAARPLTTVPPAGVVHSRAQEITASHGLGAVRHSPAERMRRII
ncbi:hypothetical protein [Sporomusa ovata]|uniref:Uncharacterized protein n=2 Tax=Sporomusa ovata TaxID=2378 RepID=A0A0U1L1M8_9FIRM|nr:hypothetical protein [Sporomusa ovata]CQR73586.1 hypothetical protein SpAn4DRAFT_0048 [Sporomusa ovata]